MSTETSDIKEAVKQTYGEAALRVKFRGQLLLWCRGRDRLL